MRLGGPVYIDTNDPEQWAAAVRAKGYRAAYCPVQAGETPNKIAGYARAASSAGLVIAEVGVWNNPLSRNAEEQGRAIQFCKQQLALADEIGALCCVNIAGSRGELWDGPHPDNFTQGTFDQIVTQVREIIDDVRPRRTFYTLEPMPWVFPDSPDSYLELIHAVDRREFAVHLDPVNMVSSPRRYFDNSAFLAECFEKLGPWIKSVHAKDILLSDRFTTHLDEVRPGAGFLDYRTLLHCMERLSVDTPLMLEHLQLEEEYDQSAAYIRQVAAEVGISLA